MNVQSHRSTLFTSFMTLRPAAVVALLLLAVAILLSACGGDEPALPPADSSAPAGSATAADTGASSGSDAGRQAVADTEPINVVVGNAVLADLVAQVGGDRVSIHNLIPPGSDAHSWQSSPQDSVRIAEANVIVSNGADFSEVVEQLIESAASPDSVQVIASDGLEPQELVELPFPGEEDHHEDEKEESEEDHGDGDEDDHGDEEDGHGGGDPHFWLNPRLAVHYVNQIANGLVAADPDNASVYLDNAAAYVAELEALDASIVDTLAGIPAEHRVIVTFHDAFGYFATRYDMEVMAFVGGHGGDVSPDDIVRVLDLVEHEGLPAVFAEPQFSADALEQVARDAGVAVGLMRALPDDAYPDYLGMMRANADSLASLLK